MKRKLRLSALVVLAVLMLSLLIGGLYGYFSDEEKSRVNSFTAGTLNLLVTENGMGPVGKYVVTDGADGFEGNVVFSRIAPGESGTVTWELKNTGNLNGTLSKVSAVGFNENDPSNEPENVAVAANGGTNLGLGGCMGVKLIKNGTVYVAGTPTQYVTLDELKAKLNLEPNETLAANGTITYVLEWQIAADVVEAGVDGLFGTGDDVAVDDNIIQGDTATIDITFILAQIP